MDHAAEGNQPPIDRSAATQFLYRPERSLQTALEGARDDLAAGRIVDGLAALQGIFDAPEDGLLWPEAQPVPVSLQLEAERLFESLPASAWSLYEDIYGREAARMLEEAAQLDDANAERAVARRFFHTAAGFAAASRWAERQLNAGRFEPAARGWKRLLKSPVHTGRITPTLILKAAWAHRLAGQTHEAEQLFSRVAEERVSIGGRMHTARSWWHSAQDAAAAVATRELWPVAMGTAGRNATSQAATPYLVPAWTNSFHDRAYPLVRHVLAGWQGRSRRDALPLAAASSAVIVGGAAVVRDFAGLRKVDLRTGQNVWTFPCRSSLVQLTAQLARQRRLTLHTSEEDCFKIVDHAWAQNPILGLLAADSRRVYAVDDLSLTHPTMRRRSIRIVAGMPVAENEQLQANRLIAVDLDAAEEEGAGILAWSTPGPPPLPEWFTAADRDADEHVTPEEFADGPEKFALWDMNADRLIDRAEARAAAGPIGTPAELSQHYFLGPPLPVDGCLYAVTETSGQFNLVALHPETGELLWKQGLAFSRQPASVEPDRLSSPCSPSYAEGLLVCPTPGGMMVAVDPLTGRLAWSYHHGDGSVTDPGRSSFRPAQVYTHAAFPNLPMIHRGRVVYAPPTSEKIHCVELLTGRGLWLADREMSAVEGRPAEYVATLTDELALVVGSEQCRALSLQTGEVLWTLRVGPPSGRGVRAGPNYLVPLESGRVATIDLASGREVGLGEFAVTPSGGASPSVVAGEGDARAAGFEDGPGHLVAGGEWLLSSTPTGMAAFPDASHLLAAVRTRLKTTEASPADRLLAAELELALGRVTPAESDLRTVLTAPGNDVRRERAELLLRELLHLKLEADAADAATVLRELEELSRTPQEQARFLLRQGDVQVGRRDFAGLLETTRRFSALPLKTPLPRESNSPLLVSAESWVPEVLARLDPADQPDASRELREWLQSDLAAARSRSALDAVARLAAAYSGWTPLEDVRTELAARYVEDGRFQPAELLLLENRRSSDRRAAATATALLAELWDRLGLYSEAARLVDELAGVYADVPLPDGRLGRDAAARLTETAGTGRAWRQRQRIDRPIASVRITRPSWVDAETLLEETLPLETFGGERSRAFTPHGLALGMLSAGSEQDGEFVVINRETAGEVGRIVVSGPLSQPTLSNRAFVGHFFPLGGTGVMHGLSLLETGRGGPVWTVEPAEPIRPQATLLVGPAGPSFCTFQARQHLVVVDPAAGRVLWQRTDLDPNGGLNGDRQIGIVGDERALAVFAPDRAAYAAYHTRTGRWLRSGRLDADPQRSRYAYGGKLFHVYTATPERRLRCWDAAEDRLVVDEPLEQPRAGRIFVTRVEPEYDQMAALVQPGRLRVYDGHTAEVRLDVPMDVDELADVFYIRVFRDQERYYVNLQATGPSVQSRERSMYVSGMGLPEVRVFGYLYAVDARTGRRLWRRWLEQTSLLALPDVQLPFLVGLSQRTVYDARQFHQTSLTVEVLDATTGDELGRAAGLPLDRFVHAAYDRERARLEVFGMKGTIRLEFGPGRLRLPDVEQPM